MLLNNRKWALAVPYRLVMMFILQSINLFLQKDKEKRKGMKTRKKKKEKRKKKS